jgi:hypothetical protein
MYESVFSQMQFIFVSFRQEKFAKKVVSLVVKLTRVRPLIPPFPKVYFHQP